MRLAAISPCLALGLATACGVSGQPSAPGNTVPQLLDRCVALAWDHHPPLLEGWAIPDTLQVRAPGWLASAPDTSSVREGDLNGAYPSPPNEATWRLSDGRLEFQFRTPYGYRKIWFRGWMPTGRGKWEQSVEFDYRAQGRVTGRYVTCRSPAS